MEFNKTIQIKDECEIELYPYDKLNRLEQPEKYQFSIYGGYPFLKSYESSRTKAIKCHESRLKVNNNIDFQNLTSQIVIEYFFSESNVTDSNNRVLLSPIAKDFIACWKLVLFASSSEEVQHMRDFIMVFIKKFEVSKKIYDQYDLSNYKRITTEYKSVMNYLIFSNMLCDYLSLITSQQERLIVFNVILKLNDLIVSVDSMICQPIQSLMALLCLYKERNFYQVLIEEV